jgi:hypothetical protein
MSLDLDALERRYPDPDGDVDPEPHEWADGILGEWANGASIPIRAANGDVKLAALRDIERIYGEWAERGKWLRALIQYARELEYKAGNAP